MGVPAMAMMAGGTLLGIAGTLAQGEASARAAEYNAQIEEDAGRRRADLVRKRGRRALGTMRTSIAKSGVRMEGSPMDAFAESAANIELDALNAIYAGETSAAMRRFEAKSARKGARISAGAQLLSGGAQTIGAGYQTGVFS